MFPKFKNGIKIISEIGRGGMAVVYKAYSKSQDGKKRIVAIKTIDEERRNDSSYVKRFKEEINILEKLSHPSIIPIVSTGQTEEGFTYLEMVYVKGAKNLEELKNNYLQNDVLVLKLYVQIQNVIEYLHLNNINHADISPSNIIQTKDGKCYLIDFGISREIEADFSTKTSMMFGKFGFTHPEVSLGGVRKKTHDYYSLAATLYYLYQGETLYPDYIRLKGVEGALDKVSDQKIKGIISELLNISKVEDYFNSSSLRNVKFENTNTSPVQVMVSKEANETEFRKLMKVKDRRRRVLTKFIAIFLLLSLGFRFYSSINELKKTINNKTNENGSIESTDDRIKYNDTTPNQIHSTNQDEKKVTKSGVSSWRLSKETNDLVELVGSRSDKHKGDLEVLFTCSLSAKEIYYWAFLGPYSNYEEIDQLTNYAKIIIDDNPFGYPRNILKSTKKKQFSALIELMPDEFIKIKNAKNIGLSLIQKNTLGGLYFGSTIDVDAESRIKFDIFYQTCGYQKNKKYDDSKKYLNIYEDTKGSGESAEYGDTVTFHVEMELETGEELFSTYFHNTPNTTTIEKESLRSEIEEIIIGMRSGGIRRAIVPLKMAYTDARFENVHSDSSIIIKIELLKIKKNKIKNLDK